jgi:hypothetical protein
MVKVDPKCTVPATNNPYFFLVRSTSTGLSSI